MAMPTPRGLGVASRWPPGASPPKPVRAGLGHPPPPWFSHSSGACCSEPSGARGRARAVAVGAGAALAAVCLRRSGHDARGRRRARAARASGPARGAGVATAEPSGAGEALEVDINVARLFLALTAACWGTYPVFIKVLGTLTGGALDASLVTVIRYTMFAGIGVALLPPGVLPWNRSTGQARESAPGGAPVDTVELAKASLEIAALGIAGTLFNTWGIEHTTAIRAAILLSSINVITPLLSVLIGSSEKDRNVSLQTWLSCGVSFAATAYATLPASPGAASGLRDGDFAVLIAAVCYSATKVRLAAKARAFEPETFSAGRLIAGALISWVIFAATSASGLEQDWQGKLAALPLEAWGLLLLSSLIPGVIATVLQAKGQRVVPPAQAQTIYAAVPLFAATYDFFVLQEPIEDRELAAGLAIVAGAALALSEDSA